MKTVKFVCSDARQTQFALAVRTKVNDYFRDNGILRKGNLSLAIQTIVMLSLYIIPFILIFIKPMNPWLALLMAALTGTGMAGIGMCVMHDAIHGSYSDKEWINKLHYRKIAPIVENTAKEFGFAYNLKPTFGKAFYSHIQRLKELGRPS